MDSLGDVLKSKRMPREPDESRLIKQYVQSRYKVKPQVIIAERSLTIVVPNAALAGTLRLEMPNLVAECHLTKKLYIRIN
jgi:hypothetical protein